MVHGRLDDDDADVDRISGSWLVAFYDLQGGDYEILNCPVCRGEFVASLFGAAVWPLPSTTVPDQIPEQVALAFVDSKRAHAVGAEIGSVMAARTALIRMLRDLKVSKFKDLYEKGRLSLTQYQQADEIRLWAGVAGHEGYEETSASNPTEEDVTQLMEYLDQILDTLYVKPRRLEALAERRTRKNSTAGGRADHPQKPG